MSNYKKFSLDDIRKKLKEGEYGSLVGANRAIGKTHDLSESDRAKAKVLAAKHFGAEPAPVKKRVKKTAKKGRAKAAAPVKRVAKKARAEKAAPAKRGKKKKATKKAAKKAARAAKAGAVAPPTSAPSATPGDRVQGRLRTPSNGGKIQSAQEVATEMGSVIGTVDQALKSMEFARQIYPKADFTAAVNSALSTMTRAVRVLDQRVVSPHVTQNGEGAAATIKVPSNRGKKGVKRKPSTKAAEKNGTSHLSPEEVEQLNLAKNIQPSAMAAAGLKGAPSSLNEDS